MLAMRLPTDTIPLLLTLLRHARIVLEASVATEVHPRSAISITLQVVHDDGSLLAALINCASLCLLDAAVPLRGTLAAASCGFRKSADGSTPDPKTEVVLDMTNAEESASAVTCTVAITGSKSVSSEVSVPFFRLAGSAGVDHVAMLRSHGIDASLAVQRSLTSTITAKLSRLTF